MSERHVIVHGNCYDGHGAAWVALKAMPDAIVHYALYGKPIPDVPEGVDCWMIDISFPRPEMEALAARVNLRVLDHHKTAQAALDGFPNCVFDMTRSGAMLAWDEFFGPAPAPRLIEYVQDQDLWTWKMPDSAEICSFIRSWSRDIDSWNMIAYSLEHDFYACRQEGEAIMRSERQRVEEMCEQARMFTIGGYVVPVVNASVQFSAVGNLLCKKYPKAAFAAYYFDRADGQRQWGLRSVGEFDVSAIAKIYGGGGHKNASGFQTTISENEVTPWSQ